MRPHLRLRLVESVQGSLRILRYRHHAHHGKGVSRERADIRVIPLRFRGDEIHHHIFPGHGDLAAGHDGRIVRHKMFHHALRAKLQGLAGHPVAVGRAAFHQHPVVQHFAGVLEGKLHFGAGLDRQGFLIKPHLTVLGAEGDFHIRRPEARRWFGCRHAGDVQQGEKKC